MSETLSILWHALGMTVSNYRRSVDWWLSDDKPRNYYFVTSGDEDYQKLIEMEQEGLVHSRETPKWYSEDGVYFHATEKGILLAREEFFKKRENNVAVKTC